MNNIPMPVLDEIEDRRIHCPFALKGINGCLLVARPDLTEIDPDDSEVYYHATCSKRWEHGSYDPETSDPSVEVETCYDHPVYTFGEGVVSHIADWG